MRRILTAIRFAFVPSACLLTALVGAGCADAEPADDEIATTGQELRRQHIPHPQGAYETEIRASGTGCPAGTWNGALSPDGETFTISFSAYEAKVAVGQAQDIKDCNVDLDFGSGDGIQFSVASFYYQGYVFLEKEGMKARHHTKYHFANLRENDADKNEVSGPSDDSYLFSDEIAPPRREWTRCKRRDTLRIKTRLVMKNDRQATGEGYINTSTIDGTLSFRWAMKWRRCQL
jgi:hypothetical protein